MGQFATLSTEGGLNEAVARLLAKLLDQRFVAGVMVPCRQADRATVMQTLVTDPAALAAADPFAPVVPTSSARLLSGLTTRGAGQGLAVVVRSCELRAFLELCKLHQGSTDKLLVIGVDCVGRFENADYRRLVAGGRGSTAELLRAAQAGDPAKDLGCELAVACRVCEHPTVEGADLRLGFLGADPAEELLVERVTDRGQEALAAIALSAEAPAPSTRTAAVEATRTARQGERRRHFDAFREQTATLAGLSAILSGCINCYNCRVACPVCYCRECVFVTDTFRHDGERTLLAAGKRGQLRLPTDTAFYHLTRMIHMSTLCVGCGQCSSACPNEIPVMELIATTAERTQARFGYVPGRALGEAQPLATFLADELPEVTGQVK